MKRKWILTISAMAVAGLIALGQHASAQSTHRAAGFGPGMAFFDNANADDQVGVRGPRGRRGGPMQGALPPGALEDLELTDAQETQLRNLRNAFAKDMARLRADLDVAHIEMRELMQGINPSASAAKTQAAKVNTAQGKIFERTVTFRVEAKNVLTPEQQEKLQDEGRHMKRGRRGEGMRGQRGFRHGSVTPPAERPETPGM